MASIITKDDERHYLNPKRVAAEKAAKESAEKEVVEVAEKSPKIPARKLETKSE